MVYACPPSFYLKKGLSICNGEWNAYTDADSSPVAPGAYLSLMGDRFYDPANARFLTRGGPGANDYQADDPNDGYWFSRLANFLRPAANLPGWTPIFGFAAAAQLTAGTVTDLHDSSGQWGWDVGAPDVSDWDTQVAGAEAIGDVVATGVALGAPLAGGIRAGLERAGAEGAGNIVYRGLAEGENPAEGLTARGPEAAGVTPMGHVAGARNSPWISASRDLGVATRKYGRFGTV
ncbi:MAG TPA: hypothetical protein VFJ58_19825, partial [Armatimonadota bacterium]|nr:hypothetical protein [Armatimonadota bacterium]